MVTLPELWQSLIDNKLRPERELVPELLKGLTLTESQRHDIHTSAVALIDAARSAGNPLLESFLKEYRLSEREGVALMCLAEALLRVPDGRTRDQLIEDKLSFARWTDHLGHSDNFWVNASSWGLALTGKMLTLPNGSSLMQALKRLGQPLVRQAVGRAIGLLGEQFVLAETLPKALAKGYKLAAGKPLYSFDMLGEGARTAADAERYFHAYESAIRALAESQSGSALPLPERSGISVKLSALYPRFEFSRREQAEAALLARLQPLCLQAAEAGIGLTIDAEESHRQLLTLCLFSKLIHNRKLHGWHGLGMVVQAYSKSALTVLAWLQALAKDSGQTINVRLVKGAYWDSEVKLAQEQGLADYPVFSRKCNTDLSYLRCVEFLLAARPQLYPAFASHNAHTLAAVWRMAGQVGEGFEFQRLHGMGESIYQQARCQWPGLAPVRIYAPVGSHRDLLAYLVRRLIENGANSSFVNQLADASCSSQQLAADPITRAAASTSYRHGQLPLPCAIFGERPGAAGRDLSSPKAVAAIASRLQEVAGLECRVEPLVAGWRPRPAPARRLYNPANWEESLGEVCEADTAAVDAAIAQAEARWPAWRDRSVGERAACLERAANALEADIDSWLALLVREGGKTWGDAVAEVREAVDFCRYYSRAAQSAFGTPQALPVAGFGISGEANYLSWQGRGVFVCISPWNFPLAIFIGQVAAALVSGNAVLAKPAEQTPLVAYRAVELLHECGVPAEVLSLLPGGRELGATLVALPQVAGVAFTGSVAAAQAINRALAAKAGPIVPLIAETGGQNVMIADSSALLEQLCDDVIRSAFASAGQRCSALRALLLQEEIYDQALAMIKGAMAELAVGDPQQLACDLGPIIDGPALERLQGYIESQRAQVRGHFSAPLAESLPGHFLAPQLFELDSLAQIPGEQFGPILHVVRFTANQLPLLLADIAATGFGLTLGVHTRLESRWQALAQQAPVGNIYINRNMIGAVVGLQPFGGMGLSGTGFKAGGSHYLSRFAVEKSLSVNTMAVGGNTQLLSLSDDERGCYVMRMG
ncbi:bifunctional proline dehydrogenase/L-glutamate gamma-semialdehyde dehydrogenase PutA [Halioxenophilus sp. WMMB6]|uniref:bifunctional proline dehydrogenase/L-glutamate gamma-semialdehyde dehydrogenase PutA n=1 Tax=Halioxenophilus sp. WMMB6 TaxID=3073815 RepID=UPI00295F4E20|nr:bifunctional proline dehydrogenase/L-glutamate gamma-semialdehyde dehydrogenase PutA [Halioxenophilus sp. WMMB6]